ncbi:tannase/feruloyl esterase family alpha/beta hydrolase [Mumia sp. DW29H23]|uniref:tannase/feruloyl esterase family alpha/beta hydrolase n=1 Tax=Mumia sp. DW29H23 TaxID=3421241 RepID=UPI003D6837B5
MTVTRHQRRTLAASLAVVAAFALVLSTVTPAAASGRDPRHDGHALPQLAPARPGTLTTCEALAAFAHPRTTITMVERVPAGTLTNAGAPVGEHCLVRGRMNERTSDVDGQTYAIGFEARLPVQWAGRFLYQANGGIDGNVVPATGSITGGQLENGLQLGFAVLSSDAGHSAAQNPLFGRDPQARLDYGYAAVGTVTPMAKRLVAAAYGRGPDRSYIAGGSNGGRHTMVASARYADQYDGFLAVAPGFNLPKAAVAQLWGAQQWATIATTTADLETALPVEEREVVAAAILRRCDRLDGLADGLVQDSARCQRVLDLRRDVPTCADGRDGTCLTREQKRVVQRVFDGARDSRGRALYRSFPFDPGIVQPGWAAWKFRNSVQLDPAAVGFIFSTPPADVGILADLRAYALAYDVDTEAPKIFASDDVYAESAMSLMTPPDPTDLGTLRDRGAKMIVVHGAADGVFSPDDTASWYEGLERANRQRADRFVRYFEVPGMGHVRGGPATDQLDGLAAIVAWVEHGDAPDRIIASARGQGNPGGVNPDVPADWAPDRTRPLCPYPAIARYTRGDPEDASSFVCRGRGVATRGH